MTLRVVTPATTWPASLEEAKKRLGILHDDDDTVVKGLLASGTAALEAATQRRFMRQTLEWVLPCWPPGSFRLPIAGEPIEVEVITYAPRDGGPVELPLDQVVIGPAGQTIGLRPVRGLGWPVLSPDAAEPVVIRFTVGPTGQGARAPAEAVTAVLFMVEYLNDPTAPGWKLAASGLPDSVELLADALRWE